MDIKQTHIQLLKDAISDYQTDFSSSIYESMICFILVDDQESKEYILNQRNCDGSWGAGGPQMRLVPSLSGLLTLAQEADPSCYEKIVITCTQCQFFLKYAKEFGFLDSVAVERIVPFIGMQLKQLIQLRRIENIEVNKSIHKVVLCIDSLFNINEFESEYGWSATENSFPQIKHGHSFELYPQRVLEKINLGIDSRNPPHSLGCSVASTLAVFRANSIPSQELLNEFRNSDGGIPMGVGMKSFEILWVGLFMYRRSRWDQHCSKILRKHFSLNRDGLVGGGDGLPVDADDSSVCGILTENYNSGLADRLIETFWNGEYFNTYQKESTASLTTNAHCMEFLANNLNRIDDDSILQVTYILEDWLINELLSREELLDKWHVSPLYSYCELFVAISSFALYQHKFDKLAQVVNAISTYLKSHKRNNEAQNLESIEFLNIISERASYLSRRLLAEGRSSATIRDLLGSLLFDVNDYLLLNCCSNEINNMWIGKEVYSPWRVVSALTDLK